MTDLKALSDAATQGDLLAGDDGIYQLVTECCGNWEPDYITAGGEPVGGPNCCGNPVQEPRALYAMSAEDAAFFCALVDEYRANRLVPAAALAEATEDSLAPLDDMATRRLQGEVERLRAALTMMVEHDVDYARLNNLGDPEKLHRIQVARAALGDQP